MTIQDFIAEQTDIITEGILRSVRALPTDKLDWKPMGNGRSAIDQLAECASSPQIMMRALSGKGYSYEEEDRALKNSLKTIEEAERCLREGNAKLLEMIRAMPDEKLAEQIHLPWGDIWRLAEVANMHYWNLVYHVGQINYIQTLLGDFEMH
jgi:hypothetical protein